MPQILGDPKDGLLLQLAAEAFPISGMKWDSTGYIFMYKFRFEHFRIENCVFKRSGRTTSTNDPNRVLRLTQKKNIFGKDAQEKDAA